MPTYNTLPKPSAAFKGHYYDKLVEDLILDDKKKRTVYGYVLAVRKLAEFHRRPPELLCEQDIRDYLLHQIIDREVASGTQSVILSGLKFFLPNHLPKRLEDTRTSNATPLLFPDLPLPFRLLQCQPRNDHKLQPVDHLELATFATRWSAQDDHLG